MTEADKNHMAVKLLNEQIAKLALPYEVHMLHHGKKLSKHDNIEIRGLEDNYIAHWHDVVEMISAYDIYWKVIMSKWRHISLETTKHVSKAFQGLASQSVDELLVKLDLQFTD